MREFVNEPPLNMSLPENKERMKKEIAKVRNQLETKYPLIIGGERYFTKRTLASTNPWNRREVVGLVSWADRELAETALFNSWEAFRIWRKVKPTERANYLFKMAVIMRRRAFELCAWLTLEVSKNYQEAYGEVSEAIDLLEYYGREMLRYSKRDELSPHPYEKNELVYMPLGAGIVIPPWNFPLAVLTGMTSAAVVAGNTVVLKPADTAPVIAAKFMEVVEEAGLPSGVINLINGDALEVGEYLVQNPRTRFVNFVGSKRVGLRIREVAAKQHPEQMWMKRVLAELGGKNTIVVDETADLDAAARGIVRSAFGFQGQKCSACSRAVIVEDIYHEVLNRVLELTNQIKIQSAEENSEYSAIIDEKSYKTIMEYIAIGKTEGRLVVGGTGHEDHRYTVEPTIFADVSPKARIAKEEIFGPVLAIIKANDFGHAIDIANNTEYGRTGSVFSQDRARLKQAKEDFEVGNLYLNRGCTGALVGMHPFGGFKMSGDDCKAGGRDYLALFMQAKSISEHM